MQIRLAKYEDIETIMEIYAYARGIMQQTKNPTQWKDNYPSKQLIESDIENQYCYVGVDDAKKLRFVFAFICDVDPTYGYIEEGQWLNDEPYGTIHRIASDGQVKGVFNQCVEFCREQKDNIRIDTHADNKIMQHQIQKNGFVKCGIIYVEDKSPRLAYQWTRLQ